MSRLWAAAAAASVAVLGLLGAAPTANAAPAPAATTAPASASLQNDSFSVTCYPSTPDGYHAGGSVTMTGTWHYTRGGSVTLDNAKVRANGAMFTITTDRLADEAAGNTVAWGYTGVLSAGEAFPYWNPNVYIPEGFGLWYLHGRRTDWSAAELHGCRVRG